MIPADRPSSWWWLAAILAAVAGLALLPADPALSANLTRWSEIPQLAELIDVVRVFGHGEVMVLVAVALGAAGRRREAVALIVGLVLMGIAVWAMKYGIGRVRPNGGRFSFPSGDAATAAVLLPVLARSWRRALLPAAIAATVALGRVVQQYHFPSDVLAGCGVGIACGAVGLRLAASSLWSARIWLIAAALLYAAALVAVNVPAWQDKSRTVGVFLAFWAPALAGWTLMPWLRPLARRAARPVVWAVAVVVLAGGAWLASRSTLWDVDEPRNAGTAVTMVAGGDYLVPVFNGEPRLHKPPLAYWMMALPLKAGLPADWSCRLPAVAASALAVVLLALLARLVAPAAPAAAGWAALCLAGVPLVWVVGTAATTDGVLLVGILLAQCGVVAALQGARPAGLVVFTGAAIAWGLLAKGPLAVLVPVSTALGAAWMLRGRGAVGWRHLGAFALALALGTAVFLAWFLPANEATAGGFVREGVGKHVVQRGITPFEGHGGRFLLWLPYYIPVLALAMLPWTALVPAGIAAVLRGDHGRTVRAVLVAWFLPTFVILSFYATKLPHYGLVLVPALALAVGLLMAGEPSMADRRWLRVGWWLTVPLLAMVAVGAAVAPWFAPGLPPRAAAGALGAAAAFALMAALLHRPLRAAAPRRAALAAAVGTAALLLTIGLALPAIDANKPVPRLARSIAAAGVPVAIPVFTSGFEEPSLVFYLGRGSLRGAGGPEDLAGWARQAGPALLITTAAVMGKSGPLPLREVARAHGWNPNKGRPVELVALARGF